MYPTAFLLSGASFVLALVVLAMMVGVLALIRNWWHTPVINELQAIRRALAQQAGSEDGSRS